MNSHLSEDQISGWIAGEREAGVERHLRECSQCAGEVERIQSALLLFRESGTQVAEYWQVQPLTQRVPVWGKWAVAGVALAAVVLAAVVLRHPPAPQPPPLPPPTQQVFMRIPYVVPPAPYERTEIMHMDVPVAALIAAGFRMDTASAGASVAADVLVGQDGRPLAVSFPENRND